jgi:hypothetical protein
MFSYIIVGILNTFGCRAVAAMQESGEPASWCTVQESEIFTNNSIHIISLQYQSQHNLS